MALTQPGTYVLYEEAGVDEPPWPAIVYVDEYAPNDVQRRRPSGYVTLVLLMGEPHRFRWASTRQLSPLADAAALTSSIQTKELKHAYGIVAFMEGSGLGVDYWRDELAQQSGAGPGPSATPEPGDVIEIHSEDDEMREILRLSYHEHYGSPPPSDPSDSRHGKKRVKRQGSPIVIEDDDDDKDDNMDLYSLPHPRNGNRSSMKRPLSANDELNTSFTKDENWSTEHDMAGPSSQQNNTRSQFSGATTLDQFLSRSSLGQRSSAPTSDAIDSDISKSRDFVQMAVGPGQEIRTLLKKDVWDRPYFQDSRSGRNHFHLNDDNMWELHHDALATIDLEDFRFVAEFLTDGAFGHRGPEGKEQMKECTAQCFSAWATGEKLGMDDMLEHIAEKVHYLDWDNEEVLTMAIMIYRSSSPVLHAHDMMRKWVSGLLAHHFWTYVKDEGIGNVFRKRMRMLPELERDVFIARAESLTRGAEVDSDLESDEDEAESMNDADL